MKTITFFNNMAGVGKTALVYHVAYMFAEMGKSVLAVDLDPQVKLSQMFLNGSDLEHVFSNDRTIKSALRDIKSKEGEILSAHAHKIISNLYLIPGDLDLSLFEDLLSQEWHRCFTGEWYPFAVQSAFYRIIKQAANSLNCDYVLIDIGPNFGAINRACLLSSDYLIVPTTADLFSLKGLSNIGAKIKTWAREWKQFLADRNEETKELQLPTSDIFTLGYILMQHGITPHRLMKAQRKFADRIPQVFRASLKGEEIEEEISISNDPYCLAMIKHYNSLMPMAMEARKPIFDLKPADGAIGAHFHAVRKVHDDFEKLCTGIAESIEAATEAS